MRNVLILVLVLSVFNTASSQSKKCFKSIEEIKQTATGYWKVENSDSNTIYKISFKKAYGIMEQLDASIITEERVNKYDLAFREKQVLTFEKLHDCYNVGVEVKAKFGSVYYELEFVTKAFFKFKNTTYKLVKF